jgi:hypothetical protein
MIYSNVHLLRLATYHTISLPLSHPTPPVAHPLRPVPIRGLIPSYTRARYGPRSSVAAPVDTARGLASRVIISGDSKTPSCSPHIDRLYRINHKQRLQRAGERSRASGQPRGLMPFLSSVRCRPLPRRGGSQGPGLLFFGAAGSVTKSVGPSFDSRNQAVMHVIDDDAIVRGPAGRGQMSRCGIHLTVILDNPMRLSTRRTPTTG